MLMSPCGDGGYSSNGKSQHPSFSLPGAHQRRRRRPAVGGGVEVDKTGALCVLTKTDGDAEERVAAVEEERGGADGRGGKDRCKEDRQERCWCCWIVFRRLE